MKGQNITTSEQTNAVSHVAPKKDILYGYTEFFVQTFCSGVSWLVTPQKSGY